MDQCLICKSEVPQHSQGAALASWVESKKKVTESIKNLHVGSQLKLHKNKTVTQAEQYFLTFISWGFHNYHSKPAGKGAEQQLITVCAKCLPLAPSVASPSCLQMKFGPNIHKLPLRASRLRN